MQHPTGGVVGELRVREGAKVKAGDVVVRLDETVTRANLADRRKKPRRARGAAGAARGGARRPGPSRLSRGPYRARAPIRTSARVIVGEHKLFELRRTARAGKKAQLNERIGQLREQIRGLEEQIAGERPGDRAYRPGARRACANCGARTWSRSRALTALERDAARLQGERGALVAATAAGQGQNHRNQLQIMQIDQDLRSEVGKDLAEIRAKTSELVEKRVAAEDQLKRIDIRAPQDGTVHQLAVHTVGGVISAGEPIMLIVPSHDALVVEAKHPAA